MVDQGVITHDVLDYRYPGSGTEEDPFLITWIPDDPRDPMGFSLTMKIGITVTVSVATLAIAVAASAHVGSIKQVMDYFDIGNEVATLGLSLFVLGFAWGPLFWAPLSEFVGRQLPFIVSLGVVVVLLAACAGSQDIESLLILRFLAGAFGSSPLTNAGGVVSDMFSPEYRGLALSLFAAAPFMGPALGPVIGGFLGMSAGWRWVEGIVAVFAGLMWIVMTCLVPETYAPVLLRRRAERLTRVTGRVYRTELDMEDDGGLSVKHMFGTSLLRPWVLLFCEPIVLSLSIYMYVRLLGVKSAH